MSKHRRNERELDEEDKRINKIIHTLQDVCVYERPDQSVEQLLKDTNDILSNIGTYKEVVKKLKILKNEIKWIIEGTCTLRKIKDCSEMRGRRKTSGVYTIHPEKSKEIKAYCDMSTDGGGWTVVQRRIDGKTNFDRNWIDYKEGFGDLQKEFWLGNKYLNILTTSGKYELRVDLTDTSNKMTYALYKTFSISDENSKYKLTIGDYSGTAVDSLKYSNGRKFSTKDSDSDIYSGNCAVIHGAWWHGNCSNSLLNYDMKKNKLYWRGHKYIKSTMMIRKIA
ncbi:fibrinogen-like protein A [Mytilus californianus]|uniref:fibrinogen-like protein A n=1 Tax=Mytilus californianus TaxID=6549 RepID=UPI00224814B1|nr:fibrinogen-like protein A [Mytilus californianus]